MFKNPIIFFQPIIILINSAFVTCIRIKPSEQKTKTLKFKNWEKTFFIRTLQLDRDQQINLAAAEKNTN